MRMFDLLVVDAFTDCPYKGNPCAVVTNADPLSSQQMQTIAQETNLSETAFVLSSGVACCRVRYFTPRVEIPFAGHPTIAVAFVLAETGQIALSSTSTIISIEFSIGVLPVTIELCNGKPTRVVMTQPPVVFGKTLDCESAASAVGLTPADLCSSSPPQVAGVGVPFLMIGVKDRETLLNLAPDWELLCQVCTAMKLTGVYAYAPGGRHPTTSLCARFFDPFSQYEDPFTGSACGAMAALARQNRLIAGSKLIVEQGEAIGRIGYADVYLDDVEKSIQVGGSAVRVLSGVICSPHETTSRKDKNGGLL